MASFQAENEVSDQKISNNYLLSSPQSSQRPQATIEAKSVSFSDPLEVRQLVSKPGSRYDYGVSSGSVVAFAGSDQGVG